MSTQHDLTSEHVTAAVQKLINDHTVIADQGSPDWGYSVNLALEVLHNLKHQHSWTRLKLHTHSPLPPHGRMTRPVLSGLSPRLLYVHPDEQIEHLEQVQRRRGIKEAKSKGSDVSRESPFEEELGDDLPPVREWVLPSHVRENWTLSRLARVFDSLCHVPPESGSGDSSIHASDSPRGDVLAEPDKWRQTKRLLLAAVDDDSTVVYYIAHDGIVKPRQN